jgi:hypothetical protein
MVWLTYPSLHSCHPCNDTSYLAYFLGMNLDEESAHSLHMKYLTEYGLAIRGLSRHHAIGIDPTDGSNSTVVGPPSLILLSLAP